MKKHELAQRLRERQYKYADKEVLDNLNDTEIIYCYNECSCCGGDLIPSERFKECIKQATSVEHFMDLIDMQYELSKDSYLN